MRTNNCYKYTIYLAALLLAACNIINPDEDIPTYFKVEAFQYKDSSNAIEPSLPKVDVVYAYFNGNSIGTFDLPATIPVLMGGKAGRLQLIPGITLNGIKSTVSTYPFYYSFNAEVAPSEGNIIDLSLSTGYRSNISTDNQVFFEGFEVSNQFLNNNSDTGIVTTTDPTYVHTNYKAGLIWLTKDKPFCNIISTSSFAKTTSTCFLEFNYKCSNEFQVGVVLQGSNGDLTPFYLVGFKPTNTWQKVYIPLNEVMNYSSDTRRLFLLLKSELAKASNEGFVAIDNIKVIKM